MKLLQGNGSINNEGFSLMEALVSLVILGILSTIFFTFLNSSINKSIVSNRNEAQELAQDEIQFTLATRNFQDTSYSNMKGNMTIYKRVTESETLFKINISVVSNSNIELINLPLTVKR